jgi:ribose-phosphate pyrophosphokinase
MSIDEKDGQRRLSTLSVSQPNVAVTPLTLEPSAQRPEPIIFPGFSEDGYKHWTAKSGTLIANLLMTAGMLMRKMLEFVNISKYYLNL